MSRDMPHTPTVRVALCIIQGLPQSICKYNKAMAVECKCSEGLRCSTDWNSEGNTMKCKSM